ncbi:MAG TPA: FtsH protease activity modulator HflK [Spirochaetales bacterium]|nr:FtsH protease activity modulator HflK [Spirochaetales bacterium]HOV37368.1 FtsH protease activity modulator HflK [Spirochaetales bacterium]
MPERNVTPPKMPFTFQPRTVIIIVIVVALLAVIMGSFFIVDQTEEAVVLRFGKFNRMAQPGLNFKLPFNIEKNYNVPTQVIQNMTFGFRTAKPGVSTVYANKDFPEESIMLTGDLNIIEVEWIIQYRISDPKAWLFNIENHEKTIRDISQSVINQLVGDRGILDVLGPERNAIEIEGQDLMNEIFNSYNFGIRVTTVKLQNVVPPKGSVQDAFEDVNKSIQDMNRLINEGKEAYNREIPKARGEADQMIQIAQGYAAERVNRARGDVARFNSVLTEYRKDRNTTRTRLYYEMIEDVFKNEKNIELIDKNLKNFLPLKNLSQPEGGAQ